MKRINGMKESFQHSKIVYMITYTKDGKIHSRPMTNFNDDPYNKIWFPTYRKTRKIKDISENNKVMIIFPNLEDKYYYEIEGEATFEDPEVVKVKWRWWYLYWHPEIADKYIFSNKGQHSERMIINIKPIKAKTLSEDEIKHISQGYKTIIPY